MITMKVGSGAKAPVRFVFSDEVSETTVTLYQDDPPEVIRAKLQRVLELEGYAATPQRLPAPISAAQPPVEPTFTPADRAATEARLQDAQAMGWNGDMDIDKLPEQ